MRQSASSCLSVLIIIPYCSLVRGLPSFRRDIQPSSSGQKSPSLDTETETLVTSNQITNTAIRMRPHLAPNSEGSVGMLASQSLTQPARPLLTPAAGIAPRSDLQCPRGHPDLGRRYGPGAGTTRPSFRATTGTPGSTTLRNFIDEGIREQNANSRTNECTRGMYVATYRISATSGAASA